MKQFHTHYENLKVAVSAPPEVITAAYRALTKQYHPDLNRGDPEAERIMRIVNASYEVLSDPEKRSAHDEWILSKLYEMKHGASEQVKANGTVNATPTRRVDKKSGDSSVKYFWFLAVAAVVGILVWNSNQPVPKSGLPEYVAEPTAQTTEGTKEEDRYIRPEKAPNGSDWPSAAGYVKGYPIGRTNGLSKLTIDNSSNDSDMFVKLTALDADKTIPVRHALIPSRSSFTMNDIRAGSYDVRQMDLSDGTLSRSESFELAQTEDAAGTRFSVTTMTLFKVANGNMQSYPLNPEEF